MCDKDEDVNMTPKTQHVSLLETQTCFQHVWKGVKNVDLLECA